MNIEEIDAYCDQFEQRLRGGERIAAEDFLLEYQIPHDDSLLAELKKLEREYRVGGDGGGAPLDLPSLADLETEDRHPAGTEWVAATGSVIGKYKLLQQIGEGGMGVVYMAEQQEPMCRKVALKIIKPGMDSRQVIARFEAERQALAMMEHQNIAKVLDAGTTDAGRPYFVMELVRGVPITKYCDDNRLTVVERLELFVPVCQAIQHAHQKGIIHRDIKPSNVPVCNYDGDPVPKVIDFGVAKAVQQRLTEKTLFTEFGQILGTLEYMSPEQAGMSQWDIDTRSDIYSLGVLLYELLTGSTPLTKEQLRGAAFEEVLRLVRESEPPKPSTRLSGTGDALPSIAAHRRTEPKRLGAMVRGDLDWIVLKALEKDRTRRYETANGLARDIQRHLIDEPVEACPPSAAYKIRKFARKHRTRIIIAASFAAMLLVGGLAATWWYVEERITAKIESDNAELEIRDLLTRSAELRDRNEFAASSTLLDQAQTRVARLSHPREWSPQIKQAKKDLAIFEQLDVIRNRFVTWVNGSFDRQFAHGRGGAYAKAFRAYGVEITGDASAEAVGALVADSKVREALIAGLDDWAFDDEELQDRILTVANAADADPLRRKIRDAAIRGDAEAVPVLVRRLDLESLSPPATRLLCALLSRCGHSSTALDLLADAARLHPADFWLVFDCGFAYAQIDEYDEAIGYFRAALSLRPGSTVVHNNLGTLFKSAGRREEAEAAFLNAIELDSSNALAYNNLGGLLQDMTDRFEDAETAYRMAIECDPKNARARYNLGVLLTKTDRWEEIEKAFHEAITLDPKYVPAYLNLGTLLSTTGRKDAAKPFFVKALEIQEDRVAGDPDHRGLQKDLAGVLSRVGHYYLDCNDLHEAGKHFSKSKEILETLLENDPHVPQYRAELAGLLGNISQFRHAAGELGEAQSQQQEAIEILKELVAKNDSVTPFQYSLAHAYSAASIYHYKQGQYTECLANIREAIAGFQRVLDAWPADPAAAQSLTQAADIEATAKSRRAWIYATSEDATEDEIQEALNDAMAACESTDWKQVDLIHILAVCCARAGRTDEAVKYSQDVVRRNPECKAKLESVLRRVSAMASPADIAPTPSNRGGEDNPSGSPLIQ